MIAGVRTLLLSGYGVGATFYGWKAPVRKWPGAVHWVSELGCYCYYGSAHPSRKKRIPMNVPDMIQKWKAVVVGLATAHDKDAADRLEATVEELLTPFLAAPCAQIREFARQLAVELQSDPQVPYLVWTAFAAWSSEMEKSPDEEVKELKTSLAGEIVAMVEKDAKDQLPQAMIRALQWRSPEQLEKVRDVVQEETSHGRKVRLRGRESCLFLEAGGTEEAPEVCIQV